jgi:hypothetical protein
MTMAMHLHLAMNGIADGGKVRLDPSVWSHLGLKCYGAVCDGIGCLNDPYSPFLLRFRQETRISAQHGHIPALLRMTAYLAI